MAKIISNQEVSPGIYKMILAGKHEGKSGQFYMLRPSGQTEPFLMRPISLYDKDEDTISFLYQKKGKGTELFSQYKFMDDLELLGPLGNGFPLEDRNLTLIGGGIGTAPLLLLAKEFNQQFPHRELYVYLGFTDASYEVEAFGKYTKNIAVNIGGRITEDVDFSRDDLYIACGPEVMMKAAYREAERFGRDLIVSLEKRMACGVGACLGCSIPTKSKGNQKVCKDGPVFEAREVFDE